MNAKCGLVVNKLSSFLRKPLFFKLWFIPAWCLLGTTKLLIHLVSFRRLERFMGTGCGVNPVQPLLTPRQRTRATAIGQLVCTTACYTPWNSNCFPQALTAALLLRLYRVPYLLCFGLARGRNSHDYLAHAWVSSGPVVVTGGFSFNLYTVVACYLAPSLSVDSSP
ncbi:lasso peptide biosynthesis B2 protein [Halomonas alimentaria]|uniref:lasso peptide biosynthesis B2 protein n=1 Tax=Halomonas alimentaria TaxID=147248 RepID=UPI00249297CB|nr:lasso peptide biosynthesis B2 protein [Halomonas alimentaria]